ncbi:MAG: hypothetical protein JXA68_00595 [Ignavibacteriales bacterium]|nr:hypothetical protein [Ignavibacteriales bacterium]
MKNITLLSLILLIAISCGTNKSSDKKTEVLTENERLELVFGEFKTLYQELLTFKETQDFKKYGFGVGGSNSDWLNKIKKLKDNPDSKLLLKKGVVAGDLEQLGLGYASSKGQDTEVTKTFNKIFNEAINAKPIE